MAAKKKDFSAAASGQLDIMRGSQAAKMADAAAATAAAATTEPKGGQKAKGKGPAKGNKNDTPFTVWTTKENVNRWRTYQKAKKGVYKTQADFVEAALIEFMKKHPVTEEEKAELLRNLGI